MTFYGILMLSQKSASQFGDGEGALAMWKNSLTDYNDESKVLNLLAKQIMQLSNFQPKYRICAHRKIAACAGVFGAKLQTDILHNCFINDRGMEDSNVEGDLKVITFVVPWYLYIGILDGKMHILRWKINEKVWKWLAISWEAS